MLLSTASSFAILDPSTLPVAKSGYCGDLDKIVAVITDCEQNSLLSKLAVTCLQRFDSEAGQVGVRLGSNLTAKEKQQAVTEKENRNNLQKTAQSLDSLMDEASVAYNDMNYYLLNMIQPTDLDEMASSEKELVQLANDTPCFGPNKKILRSVRKNFKERYSALAGAKVTAQNMANESQRFSTDFGSSSSGVSNGVGAGSGAPAKPVQSVPKGNSGSDDSTITGHLFDSQIK